MFDRLSQRLLTLIQFTRMALVFTAISNSLCTYLLALRRRHPDSSLLEHVDWRQAALVCLVSIGLYGYGMSLNDIIDRRRDRQLAAHRPLPSGRMGLSAAHFISAFLLILAAVAGAAYARLAPAGWSSLLLLFCTALLISFYDFAGKYLVAMGLLVLGLIRFFHAAIPAPAEFLLWHPLLLFTHVALLSTVAYAWEEKRPPLTRLHWWTVIAGIFAVNTLAITLARWSARPTLDLALRPMLALPAGLAFLFVAIAWSIRRRSATSRQAGQTLMLTGLLWLIAYDSAFAAAYVGVRYAVVLLLLLPISWAMVQLMRWWSKILLLSQQPTYKRLRNGQEVPRS